MSDEFRRGWYAAVAWLLQQPRDKASNSAWAAALLEALPKLGVTEDAPAAEDAVEGNGSVCKPVSGQQP